MIDICDNCGEEEEIAFSDGDIHLCESCAHLWDE